MLQTEIDLLLEMLTYKRPHGSDTEQEFLERYIDVVEGMQQDNFGNRYIFIGENPTTMWSCHVDTVHREGGKQHVLYHKDCMIAEKDERQDFYEPLGADDAVGVFILLAMIEKGIEGLYIFHRGEEKGGLGSDYIANYTPHLVDGITHAIAFDRAGDTDIITHQFGGRCCSDNFAWHLGRLLSTHMHKLTPCPYGVFTDTANYDELIPECTNVSVGYYDEHTNSECVDLFFLDLLLSNILDADFSDMPVERVAEPPMYGNDYTPINDNAWNANTSYGGGNGYQVNPRDPWLEEDEIWEVAAAGGQTLLVKLLEYIGLRQSDVDFIWDRLRAERDQWENDPFDDEDADERYYRQ